MKQSPIIFSLFDMHELTKAIQKQCHYEIGKITEHQFPDEETVIKIDSNIMGPPLRFVLPGATL